MSNTNNKENKIIKVQLQIEEINEICKILNSFDSEFDIESHRTYIDGKDKNSWKLLDFNNPLKIHCLYKENEIENIEKKLSKFLFKNKNKIT